MYYLDNTCYMMFFDKTIIGNGSHGIVRKSDSNAIKYYNWKYRFHHEALVTNMLDSKYIIEFSRIDYIGLTTQMDLYNMDLVKYIRDDDIFANRYTKEGIEERKSIIIDIFKGLSVIHSAGLVHSDLSYGNILLKRVNGKLQVTICDLGLATISDINTLKHTTYSVESPDKIITPAHDYFAVGVLLYSMWKPTIIDMEHIPDLDDIKLIPEDFRDLAVNLMSNDPNRRSLAASKYIQQNDIKLTLEVSSESKCVDKISDKNETVSDKNDMINDMISATVKDIINSKDARLLDDKVSDRMKQAILKVQQHFDDDIYYVIAALYLILSMNDIVFNYKRQLKNIGKYNNIKIVEKHIQDIIMKPDIVKMFVQYYMSS